MCNRYVSPDQAEVERLWHIGRHNQPRLWREGEVFPRAKGPFIRIESGVESSSERTLVIGQWGLIPWFATSKTLKYSTNNARCEEVASKASYRQSWAQGKRCIIPAWSFDEPCWETGRNVWWRFRRADGTPWGLAGLWNAWIEPATGEVVDTYTLLTINADNHPLMSRMHKSDPKRPPEQQDKRSVISIEAADSDAWLSGEDAKAFLRPPDVALMEAGPLK